MRKSKGNFDWSEAKKRCRLSRDDIQMAKELGMTPRSLIKNIPLPKQQWKSPVKTWIREMYENKFGYLVNTKSTPKPNENCDNHPKKNKPIQDDELPF